MGRIFIEGVEEDMWVRERGGERDGETRGGMGGGTYLSYTSMMNGWMERSTLILSATDPR
jgi:hypothetical protein